MKLMPLLAALALLAPSASAGVLHVPGDFASLQDAIDAALPGDTILVSGTHGSVLVDKELSILGNPSFHISIGCADAFPPKHGFGLAGPGSGRMVLAGFSMGSGFDCFLPGSGISGGGFDEVHVLDADIDLPVTFLTGIAHGATAIDVDVPYLFVGDSFVRASGSASDHCAGFLYSDVIDGIRNPSGTVLVADSKVIGGSPGFTDSLCCVFCTCPVLTPSLGGEGGNGIVAREVFLAGADVSGGGGATFWAYAVGTPHDPVEPGVDCGSQPDGEDVIAAATHVLSGVLTGEGAIPLGGSWTLTWSFPGPVSLLFASFSVTPPVPQAGLGWSFLDTGALLPFGPLAASAGSAVFAVPAEPALLAVEAGFQALDATLGLTRPALGVFKP